MEQINKYFEDNNNKEEKGEGLSYFAYLIVSFFFDMITIFTEFSSVCCHFYVLNKMIFFKFLVENFIGN